MESLLAHRNRMRVRIDHKITYFKPCLFGLLGRNPAELGANSCKKLRHTKRFCQIVISTFVKCLYLHHIGITNTEHDDWGSVELTHSLSKFQTIHLRHRQICDDHIWATGFKFLQAFDAIASCQHLVSTAL